MADSQTYSHGTKADLKAGDLIRPGNASNYGERKPATFVYLSATLDAAVWGAELAVGAGRGRIYISGNAVSWQSKTERRIGNSYGPGS